MGFRPYPGFTQGPSIRVSVQQVEDLLEDLQGAVDGGNNDVIQPLEDLLLEGEEFVVEELVDLVDDVTDDGGDLLEEAVDKLEDELLDLGLDFSHDKVEGIPH